MHQNLGFTLPNKPFRFVSVSGNKKTGPIAVTSTAAQSCPSVCPFRTDSAGGCYAASGNSAIHWRALTNGKANTAIDSQGLFSAVRSIPKGQLWRHNEAGDILADESGNIDAGFLSGLTDANKGRRGFTYTHHKLTPHNVAAITAANAGGFTVNVSTNNVQHADTVRGQYPGLPIVTIVAEWHGKQTLQTPGGNTVVRCPAEYKEGITCANCGLCAVNTRRGIVGFTPHGTSKRRVINIAQG